MVAHASTDCAPVNQGKADSSYGNIPVTSGKLPAPAVFRGIQSGFGIVDDFEMWDLTADIPGHPVRSTVSRQTLEEAGYSVPESRPAALPTAEDCPPAMVHLEVVAHPSGGFTWAEPIAATQSSCRIYTGWWSNREAAQAALDAKFS